MKVNKYINKMVIGTLFGNVMEFFDFIIYVYLSKYISLNFFPTGNDFSANLLTFGVFASGYLTRPLGSLYFGYIGDKYGRKKALLYSIWLITLTTIFIGLLPTYQQVGIISPLLLVACRLLQGFSVSGEEGGAAVYLSESFEGKKDGLVGSLILGSAYFGVLLGSVVCLGCSSLFSEPLMIRYGWRLPFFFSIILGVVAIYLRISSEDKVIVSSSQNQIISSPLKILWRDHKFELAKGTFLVSALAIPIYLYTVYMPSYLITHFQFESQLAFLLSSVNLLIISCLVPLFGLFADKLCRIKLLRIGCVGSMVLGLPIFKLLKVGNVFSVFYSQCLMSIVVAMIAAPMFAILVRMFPRETRYTGVSFTFNTGMSIFGSTVPLIATALINLLDNKFAPGLYMAISGAIGFLVLSNMKILKDNLT